MTETDTWRPIGELARDHVEAQFRQSRRDIALRFDVSRIPIGQLEQAQRDQEETQSEDTKA